ncbi:hypothetical protein DFH05DRAFT_1543102 [Lentinula detonsa]|uniref:Uncharacterized protein n=1 Tax=Lentinula detonsa TaxID=2804962 RepID=A0A9W8P1S5_9AGAR|nr:hypothetical protein DFH05DRAFT_1543102 [Lentinula detonsa]
MTPQSVRLNLSFGLEYALRSGKFGDAEGFLDTNILSCLDAARTLYSDWTMLKGRKSTGVFRESRCLSADKMPLSNITNVRNKAQSSIKSCSRSADIPTLMKKRKRGPSPSGSRFALSLKRNSSGKRISSIKADADKNATSQSTGIMDEKEIQRLMKILEETVEHVDDSKVLTSTIEFQAQALHNVVSSDLEPCFSNSPPMVYSAPSLSRCLSSSVTSSTIFSEFIGTSSSRCSSASSLSSSPTESTVNANVMFSFTCDLCPEWSQQS